MAKIKPLRQSPLFKAFSDREIAIFSQVVDELAIPTGSAALPAPHGLVIIKSGSMDVRLAQLMVRLEVGDYFGELSLLGDDGTPNPLGLVLTAGEGCEVLQIQPDRFQDLGKREPELCLKVVQSLSRSVWTKLVEHGKAMEPLLARVNLREAAL